MKDKKYWFFGSKLNSVLLLVLIILMVFAIRIMLQNKATYLPILQEKEKVVTIDNINILGNKDDLVFLSILPNAKVSGTLVLAGEVKGGYFFEGNVQVNILDVNKNVLLKGHGTASTDWMTTGPVSFTTSINFTGLPKGPAYLEIHNDNASGLPANDKSILIPIVIE